MRISVNENQIAGAGDGPGAGSGKSGKSNSIIDVINNSMDDHDPGHEAAKDEKVPISKNIWEEIDKTSQIFDEALQQAKKRESGEAAPLKKPDSKPGTEATKRATTTQEFKVQPPKITWEQIINKLVRSTERISDEEVRTKVNPRRAGITATELKRSGKAIVPVVNPLEPYYPKVMFVLDSSGSMGRVIQAIQTKIKQLVSSPLLRQSIFAVMRFSMGYELFYGKFSTDEAAIVQNFKTKPIMKKQPSLTSLLNVHLTGGTMFAQKEKDEVMNLLNQGYNIVVATDSDLSNNQFLLDLYNKDRRRVFIIFDEEYAYTTFMAFAKLSSAGTITYFK